MHMCMTFAETTLPVLKLIKGRFWLREIKETFTSYDQVLKFVFFTSDSQIAEIYLIRLGTEILERLRKAD